MAGNSNVVVNNVNYTISSQQQQQEQQSYRERPQHKQAVAQVAVSFFQRIISGVNANGHKGETSPTQNSANSVVTGRNSEQHVQSVQTLKQFWINAFGGSGSRRSVAPKKVITGGEEISENTATVDIERDNSESCEPIVVDRGKAAAKSQSLNRNHLVRDAAHAKNRISDNFYKYKTADLVRTSRNGDLFLATNFREPLPDITRSDVTHLPVTTTETHTNTMIITGDARPPAASSIAAIMGDDKKYQHADSSAEKTILSSTKSLTISKSSSGSSLVGTATESSVSSSRKSGSNGASRKCSFRTNAYHAKKSTILSNGAGNKVAALTHRFNQLIQNDAEILSRKREVILHRSGGHIFKVMAETVDSPSKSKKNPNRIMEMISVDGSPARLVKKKSIVRRKTSAKASVNQSSPKPVSVKEKIQIFETPDAAMTAPAIGSIVVSAQKPAVPNKSAHVLRRTKEIVAQNSLKKLQVPTHNSSAVVPAILAENDTPKHLTLEKIKEDFEEKSLIAVTADVPEPTVFLPPKKSSVSRIYEKLAIKSSSFLARKKIYSSIAVKTIPEVPIVEEDHPESVEKIMDAIAVVTKRIEHLSKSESCLLTADAEEKPSSAIVPNPSFLFRSASKPAEIIEAINTRVITKTQSMDEVHFPSPLRMASLSETREYGTIFRETDELLQRIKESIQKDDASKVTDPPISSEDSSSIYQSIFGNESPDAIRPAGVTTLPTDFSNIYQSISEAISHGPQAVVSAEKTIDNDTISINSYESFENYEAVDDELLENITNENGYEICSPTKDMPPEPPPPRVAVAQAVPCAGSPEPALPLPKRAFAHFELQKSESSSSNYEIIKYDKIPPRPPKSMTHPMPSAAGASPLPLERNSSTEMEYDGENIYDTIKSVRSDKVENGIAAGDYESIEVPSPFLRVKRSFKRSPTDSDTGSTLSSDVKTNSLYGTTMSRQGVDVAVLHSDGDSADSRSSSSSSGGDNSDDWIDMSDGEGDNRQKHKFVVVCERKKSYRNADWSQKVRDQRINQRGVDYYEDDSDHYYESLDMAALHAAATPIHASSNLDLQDADHLKDVDYDSFDSDEETDEDIKKNDSGVDVSSTRLPDPPTSTSQVYAFMQKFRNFGSLSKNISKLTKKKSVKTPDTSSLSKSLQSPPQKYENTQFYVENNYQNVDVKAATSKSSKKLPVLRAPKKQPEDPYENTEFHQPPPGSAAPVVVIQSSPNPIPVSSPASQAVQTAAPNIFTRKKSKSGKSFDSKFRKSLGPLTGGSALATAFIKTRSTFYVTDSTDIDSGVFTSGSTASPPPPPPPLPPQSPQELVDIDAADSATTPTSSPRSSLQPTVTQRKSSLTVRPNNPPPPPPVDKRSSKSKRRNTTSWYTECGVFKLNAPNDSSQMDATVVPKADGTRTEAVETNNGTTNKKEQSNPNNSSWYADVGLYHTSGASVASSSGSSGVSTGGECGSGDDNSHSMFDNEPLYQIYSAAKLESITNDIELDTDGHSDGYEEIGGRIPTKVEPEKRPLRPSALQLIGPKQGPSRTLWSEIQEVISSEILATLTPTEQRLQEAKFEILTSEASYLKSLTLLRTHFMNHPAFRDTAILSAADRKTLFACMISVQECSNRLLCDLENCWQDNIMLLGLSHSLYKHAEKYFNVYIQYCEHQGQMNRTLKRLSESKSGFCQALESLETNAVCYGLSLHSFLMLPMQRVTRLPLLVDAVLSKLKTDDDEFGSWKMTLAILNKIVGQCNEAANRSAQSYEMEVLSRQIEFPQHIRPLAILPVGIPAAGNLPTRSLVRRDELTHLIWRGEDNGKLTFGKKFTKTVVYLFLFTDLLVLSKKRSDESFAVFDYCARSMLTVSSGEVIPQLPTKDLPLAGKHLIFLTLLENHDGKMVEMILSCASETDRQRWLHAMEPPASENPDEKLYEQWDCPQVMAKHTYVGLQPDELNLDPGDVVNVTRKMADGWYQGERMRDGASGWFPGNYTEEVASSHVRARNLKQRYRLLTFTAAYWESQKKK